METHRYIVTEKAGPKVAGRRVQVGDTLELSENAARTELLAGVIAPAPSSSAPVAETNAEAAAVTETTAEPKSKKR